MAKAKFLIIAILSMIILAFSANAYDISYGKDVKEIRYSYYDGDVHKIVVYNKDYDYPRISYDGYSGSSRSYNKGYNDGFSGSYRIGYRDGFSDRDYRTTSYYNERYSNRYDSTRYSSRYYSYKKSDMGDFRSYYDDPKYRDRYYF